MQLYNFKTAYTQLRELYGIELNPDEFETIGMIGWDKIGNKLYVQKSATIKVCPIDDPQDTMKTSLIHLPCDVDAVEAVYLDFPEYQKTDNLHETPLIYNQYTEKYIDLRRGDNNNTSYRNGKLVKYRVVGPNTLQTTLTEGTVNVLYKSISYDPDGLPLLNVKELDAIAAYCAYSHIFKQSVMTRDSSTFQMAKELENKWLKLCDHARTPISMSQNDFDAIGDAKYSWDRKSYGKTFKPLR